MLVNVPFLRATTGVQPARLAPTIMSSPQTPLAYQLYQNYPNPFNPTTTIRFHLPNAAFVTLKIYNILGQEVATLLNREQLEDGMQEVQFHASSASGGLASGVYFYRIVAEGFDDDGISTSSFTTVKKMILLK